jgi:hypothetical protein
MDTIIAHVFCPKKMARKKPIDVHRSDYPEPYYYAPESLPQKNRETLTLLNLIIRADKNRKDKFIELNICNSEMWRDACIKDISKKTAATLKKAGFIKSFKLKDEYTQIGNDCVHKFEDTGKEKINIQIYKVEKGANYNRVLPLIKKKCLPYLNSAPSAAWPYFYANFEKGHVFYEEKKFKPKLKGYKMSLLKSFIMSGAKGLKNEVILEICKPTYKSPANQTEIMKKKWLQESVRKVLDDFKREWGLTKLEKPLLEQTKGGYRLILPQQYGHQPNLKA